MTWLKIIRITILIGIFLGIAFYAQQQKLKSRSWTAPLQLTIYPINAEKRPEIDDYISDLNDGVFAPIDQFMQQQSQSYNLSTARPTKTRLGPTLTSIPPEAPPPDSGYAAVIWWGLKFRYWVFENTSDEVTDVRKIRVFVLYHTASEGKRLPHSLGLDKGLVAIVHAFADLDQDQQNNIVIAHEVLHTVGALDKYDATTRPLFPDGFADPDQSPLYPQKRAEIMAGRIPLSETQMRMASSLNECVIGKQTAIEINWLH
ncbi:MAG: hypothetical protein ACU836_16260 [Gammaproteobacteria bacterium]